MAAADIIELLILIVALSAFILSIVELRNYKQKESNNLMSQLNERYLTNNDMQTVVRYLREIDPTNEEPSAYQVELFLRFFEELNVYLRHGNLNPDDVREFFNYYLERLYHSERGQKLLDKIKHQDRNLNYLNGYKKMIKFDK